MKVLAFVDLHGSEKALLGLKKKLRTEKPDIICCSGDISIVDRNTTDMIAELDNLGKRLLIIPGNHEDEKNLEMLCRFCENVMYLHKRTFILNDVLFIGYGTGGFSSIDSKFVPVGKRFEGIIRKERDKKIVFLIHAPPYRTKLDNIMGSSCGNKNLRQFIWLYVVISMRMLGKKIISEKQEL